MIGCAQRRRSLPAGGAQPGLQHLATCPNRRTPRQNLALLLAVSSAPGRNMTYVAATALSMATSIRRDDQFNVITLQRL
jgi:hypothetical protein